MKLQQPKIPPERPSPTPYPEITPAPSPQIEPQRAEPEIIPNIATPEHPEIYPQKSPDITPPEMPSE